MFTQVNPARKAPAILTGNWGTLGNINATRAPGSSSKLCSQTPKAVEDFLKGVREAVNQGEQRELAELRAEKAALLGQTAGKPADEDFSGLSHVVLLRVESVGSTRLQVDIADQGQHLRPVPE